MRKILPGWKWQLKKIPNKPVWQGYESGHNWISKNGCQKQKAYRGITKIQTCWKRKISQK